MILFLDSNRHSAQRRLDQWSSWGIQHVLTAQEIVGLQPDLLIVDEKQGVGVVQEFVSFIPTIVVVEKVTIHLRRLYSMAQDVLTESQVKEWLVERLEPLPPQDMHQELSTPLGSQLASADFENSHRPELSNAANPMKYHRAYVLAVASLRSTAGGVGKTTLLFNEAAFWARRAKRVLVIDLDPQGVFAELAGAQGSMNTELWEKMMSDKMNNLSETSILDSTESTNLGFRLIASPRSRMTVVSKEMVTWLINTVSPFFDMVMVDMPPVLTNAVTEVMQMADRLYLVGLHDRAHYRRYKESLDNILSPMVLGVHNDKIKIVLNRSYKLKNKEIEMNTITKQLGIPVSAIIPEDPLVHDMRENSKALLVEKPNSPFSKEVALLIGEVEAAPTMALALTVPSPIVKVSLWDRFFKNNKVSKER